MKKLTKLLVILLAFSVIAAVTIVAISADSNPGYATYTDKDGNTQTGTVEIALANAKEDTTVTLLGNASVAMETNLKDGTNDKGESAQVYDPDNSAVIIKS